MDTSNADQRTSWMSVREAARRLKVSRQRVGQLIASGGLVGRRSGLTWLVSSRSVEGRIELLLAESDGDRASG